MSTKEAIAYARAILDGLERDHPHKRAEVRCHTCRKVLKTDARLGMKTVGNEPRVYCFPCYTKVHGK